VNRAVLTRYRVMAYVTAVLLIVLVFAGVPLQVLGHPSVANIVGILHGTLYCVYLFVAFELTRTMRVPLGPTLLVLLAGTIPFGAIVAERKLSHRFAELGAGSGTPLPDDAQTAPGPSGARQPKWDVDDRRPELASDPAVQDA